MDTSTIIQEGLVIFSVGIVIVFLALLLLFAVFQYVIPPLLSFSIRKVVQRQTADDKIVTEKKYDSGEEIAAVTAAICIFLDETHDTESGIMTINKSIKDYSPWSSKIYATHNVTRTTSRR